MLEYDNFSACISLKRCFTRVRGGGYGRNAWIAKITGLHPKYLLSRQFCKSNKGSLSGSGRSGEIYFFLEGPGLYEFRYFCIGSTPSNWEWSGFVYIDEQDNAIELSKADALALAKNLFGEGNIKK